MLTPAEQYLIESVKSGDKKAFAFLFSRYYADMWKYARNLVKDDSTAEDLVMDVFVRFWETAPKLEFRTSLSGYLCQSVHNHCINYLTRKHKKFPFVSKEIRDTLENTFPAAVYDNPHEGICFTELRGQIESSIGSLPEECRRIFMMSRYEELSHEEIAEKLGISKNTVKVQIYRALQKLRESIKNLG